MRTEEEPEPLEPSVPPPGTRVRVSFDTSTSIGVVVAWEGDESLTEQYVVNVPSDFPGTPASPADPHSVFGEVRAYA